jgi:predicted amidohydrolase
VVRVTVCQLPEERNRFDEQWKALCAHVRTERSTLVLLPELPFAGWFPATRAFDAQVWQRAVELHRRWETKLRQLDAAFVVGTRPVDRDARRLNEAFLGTPHCTQPIHEKRFLPDEEGFWEASWYAPGDGAFDLVHADDVVLGVQSGAFCLSSNRSGDTFAGAGWIVGPDGDVLALTTDAEPFVTLDLDLAHARAAKATYPRYVR